MPLNSSKVLSSRAIIGLFYLALEGVGKSSWALRVSNTNFNSDQTMEEYLLTSMTPPMQRWIGQRSVKQFLVESLQVTNDTFETTVRDFRKNWMHDKTGQLNVRLSEMAGRSVQHWAKLCTELLAAGTSTLTYDGANFFSASHSFGASGTLTNLLTSSDYATLNVGTAAKPTATEFVDALYDVINHFYGFKDDQGEPINEDAMAFTVNVPIGMAPAARQATTTKILTGSRDNPILDSGFTVDVVANPRLSATDAFYVHRTDGALKTFILQQRDDLKITSKAEGSDYEHDTDMWEFGLSAERAAALFGWQSCIKVTLS